MLEGPHPQAPVSPYHYLGVGVDGGGRRCPHPTPGVKPTELGPPKVVFQNYRGGAPWAAPEAWQRAPPEPEAPSRCKAELDARGTPGV